MNDLPRAPWPLSRRRNLPNSSSLSFNSSYRRATLIAARRSCVKRTGEAMRRIWVSALATSAFFAVGQNVPAFAQENNPVNSPAGGSGGFIEKIFAGVAREPTVPRPYQPEPEYPAYPPRPARGSQAASAQVASSSVANSAACRSGGTGVADNTQAAVRSRPHSGAAPALRLSRCSRFGPAVAPSADGWAGLRLRETHSDAERGLRTAASGTGRSTGRVCAGLCAVKQRRHGASRVDPKFDRQIVEYRSPEKPGTVIVDTPHHFLYLVQDQSKAMRYGIGVGSPALRGKESKRLRRRRSGRIGFRRPRCCSAGRICRVTWRAVRKTRSVRAQCILARRSTASTARTSLGPSAAMSRRVVSAPQRRYHRPVQSRAGRRQSPGDVIRSRRHVQRSRRGNAVLQKRRIHVRADRSPGRAA